jgi:hypothetical protein
MKHDVARRMAVARRRAVCAVAAGATAGLVVMGPGTAFAATPPNAAAVGTTTTAAAGTGTTITTPVSNPRCTPASFSAAQQVVEADLSGRVTQLDALSSGVDNTANHLAAGDRQTLGNAITQVELPGIQTLQSQVQQVTTCVGLRAVARSMVFNYRVYVVMTPQTHLTIVMDDETFIEGVLANLEPQIATVIQNAQAGGRDVTAAQAAFTDLKSQVSAAQGDTSGQAALLLAQTPAGFPGNWQVFLAARTGAANARTDLRAAYNDAEHIRTDLQ